MQELQDNLELRHIECGGILVELTSDDEGVGNYACLMCGAYVVDLNLEATNAKPDSRTSRRRTQHSH